MGLKCVLQVGQAGTPPASFVLRFRFVWGGNAKIGISVQILCGLCENLHVPAFKTAFDVRDGGRVGEVRPPAALDGEDAVPDGRLKSGIFFVVDVNFSEERGVGR